MKRADFDAFARGFVIGEERNGSYGGAGAVWSNHERGSKEPGSCSDVFLQCVLPPLAASSELCRVCQGRGYDCGVGTFTTPTGKSDGMNTGSRSPASGQAVAFYSVP